jgi:hypothetical protein
MNFSRLNYDTCTYQQNLKQSVDVGNYTLGMPQINCSACFPLDPLKGTIGYSPTVVPHEKLVDIDSELIGIRRKASNCPHDKYAPDTANQYSSVPVADCRYVSNEDTRLSNPPSTLRCQGWNRWEQLVENPQDRAERPFRFNVDNRILVKDNHRPYIQTPINQAAMLPPDNQSSAVVSYSNDNICKGVSERSIDRVQYWDTCSALSDII